MFNWGSALPLNTAWMLLEAIKTFQMENGDITLEPVQKSDIHKIIIAPELCTQWKKEVLFR